MESDYTVRCDCAITLWAEHPAPLAQHRDTKVYIPRPALAIRDLLRSALSLPHDRASGTYLGYDGVRHSRPWRTSQRVGTEPRQRATVRADAVTTPLMTSKCWRGSSRCAGVLACISAAPMKRRSTICLRRRSTTPMDEALAGAAIRCGEAVRPPRADCTCTRSIATELLETGYDTARHMRFRIHTFSSQNSL